MLFISNTLISNNRLKLTKKQGNGKQYPAAELLLLEDYSHSSSMLSTKNNIPVFNGPLKDGPLSVCAFLCTLLVQFFRNFTLSLHFLHVALFSCRTFSGSHSSHVSLFSCWNLFVLHSSGVGLFSCCTLSMLHFFRITYFSLFLSLFMFSSCRTFLCFTFLVWHSFYVALSLC